MSTDTESRRSGLPHAVFLQRVADEAATSAEVTLGQGLLLPLPFVDLPAPEREPPTPDVFRSQWAATERYCAELAGEGTEASHLSCIVRATGEAHQTGELHLIAPAMFAYALFLEQESHFEEAEDALETMILVGGGRLSPTDAISAWLRLGRVRRLQAAFQSADAAYEEAGGIAAAHGDRQSVLLSRIGHCNVHHFRGNLAEAERGWRAVLVDATHAEFRSIQAQAEHGLGNILQRRGQPHEGASHLWRAFSLVDEEFARLRGLNDLGLLLLSIGDVGGAEKALAEVVRREHLGDNFANAKIQLMNCGSFRRDRVTFERWRERALANSVVAPPNIRADYHLKVGIGFARFGNRGRAEQELRRALDIATAHGLHEFVFKIERLTEGLSECGALEGIESAASEPAGATEALKEVSASLASLGTE